MSPLTRNKIILYLAVIFVAGGVTGAVISWGEARQKMFGPPSPREICAHFRDRLKSELDLTPEQVRQLPPLLEKRAKQMEEAHRQAVRQIEELVRASNVEIADALKLSPEQRAKLEEMEKKRREYFGKRLKPRDNAPP